MSCFNWNEFLNPKNHIIVHCKTQEEADSFCKQMNEHGLTWCTGTSYLNNSHWKTYKEETVYDNEGSFCYLNYYKSEGGWIILEYGKTSLMKYRNINVLIGGEMNKNLLLTIYRLLQKACQCEHHLTTIGWVSSAMDIIERELKKID